MGGPVAIVFDGNPDALRRRVGAVEALAPASGVIGTSSPTAVLALAAAAAPGTLVLVDLFATDRGTSVDRPGERLIRRLVQLPATAHVRPVAWSAQGGVDVVRSIRAIGASAFVVSGDDLAEERAQLERVLAGEPTWPRAEIDDVAVAAWETWFERRFQLRWEPWIEPTLVRLAGGRARNFVAPELVDLNAAPSYGTAKLRLRQVAEAISGDNKNSPAPVAAAAEVVLAHYAAHRPLAERPVAAVSLEHGVRTLRDSPSIAHAAGLTSTEVDLVFDLEARIQAQRGLKDPEPGRPPGDIVHEERVWAAGRYAHERKVDGAALPAVVDGVLVKLADALQAIDDAAQDELYHPEARAAAALAALPPQYAGRIEGVARAGEELTWRGHSPAQLATARALAAAELRALWEAVDAILAADFAQTREKSAVR